MSFSINSNKDTNINKDLFNISTKETLSDAQNKSFFTSFFTANRVTFWIGLLGQFLSAITEFIFIFRAAGGSLPVWQSSNILPVAAGLIAVYFFEVIGVRVYLVRIVRQIANKDFKNTQSIILLVFNIIFCLSILGANFGTSIVGQTTTFISVKSSVNNSDTLSKIETALNAEIDSIRAKAERKSNALTLQAEKDKKAVAATYKSVLKAFEKSKWAEGANVAHFNNKINEVNTKKLTEIEAITSDLKAVTAANTVLTNEAITRAKKAAKTKETSILKNDNSSIAIYSIIEKYSYLLLIVFMSLSLLAIIYREVFISGSKQAVELKEVKKRPVLFSILLYGLYLKFYHFCYKKVVKLLGIQSFNYSKVMQKKEDFLSSSLFDDLQLNTSTYNAQNATNMQIHSNASNSSAFQRVTQNAKAEKDALGEHKITTIQSWFKRSDLVENSLSSKVETQKKNTRKYEAVKAELSAKGVQFIESKNNVTIKV
jgi:hypothetical protein